jgi:hypothetical protein
MNQNIKKVLLILVLVIFYSFGGAYLEMTELIIKPAYFSLYGSIYGFIIGYVSLKE